MIHFLAKLGFVLKLDGIAIIKNKHTLHLELEHPAVFSHTKICIDNYAKNPVCFNRTKD